MDSRFLACMEQILWLYGLPDDPSFPVVCFDERPCFLIGEAVEGLAMKAGQPARQHYADEKNGSCALLAAIEPRSGKRLARVFDQRRKHEYALFMKELAAKFPEAEKIRLVQDNLNTHNLSSFYETFPAEEAFALSQRFEFYYTPKSASWLNMTRDRVLSLVEAVFESPHCDQRRTDERSFSDCQRAGRESHQDQLAVLNRDGANQAQSSL